MFFRAFWIIFLVPLLIELVLAADVPKPKPRSMAEILAASKPADWRPLDPENTLYIELPSGRVVIELAPGFAPQHVANVKALAAQAVLRAAQLARDDRELRACGKLSDIPFAAVSQRANDGIAAIVRSQDNYVVQLADPNADKPELARKIQQGKRTLPAEFDRSFDPKLPFTRLPDGDVYAPEVGFSAGFPVAHDPKSGKIWLAHCYGMVGAGRDNAADSGGGTELYVVIGHAPRHLDRNVTLLGRVVQGMELLSALPRGTGPLGFYENPEQRLPLKAIRIVADLPAAERTPLEVIRTDAPLFQDLIESRRNRPEDWFHVQAGHIELCNVPIPVRPIVTLTTR